jgi:hypothetical protein
VPVGPSITALVAVARVPALLGAGAGAGTLVVIGAGAEPAAGPVLPSARPCAPRAFFGFALFAAVRLGARLATTFLRLGRALLRSGAVFSTRFFVFALLFDFALLLGLADRFVFAFLAMRVAPLLQ